MKKVFIILTLFICASTFANAIVMPMPIPIYTYNNKGGGHSHSGNKTVDVSEKEVIVPAEALNINGLEFDKSYNKNVSVTIIETVTKYDGCGHTVREDTYRLNKFTYDAITQNKLMPLDKKPMSNAMKALLVGIISTVMVFVLLELFRLYNKYVCDGFNGNFWGNVGYITFIVFICLAVLITFCGYFIAILEKTL